MDIKKKSPKMSGQLHKMVSSGSSDGLGQMKNGQEQGTLKIPSTSRKLKPKNKPL